MCIKRFKISYTFLRRKTYPYEMMSACLSMSTPFQFLNQMSFIKFGTNVVPLETTPTSAYYN